MLLFVASSISVFAQKKMIGSGGATGNFENDSRVGNSMEGDTINRAYSGNDSLLNVGNLKKVKTYSFYSPYIGFQEKIIIDTTLYNIELYNPTKQAQTFSQDLGIIGSASTPLILNFKPQVSSDIGIQSFDLFIRDLSEVVLIETESPITQLSYVQGTKKQNMLQVQHAQSFKDQQIKAGLDFKLLNTSGYYTNQKTDIKNFNVNLSYQTKDRRYSAEGVYFHNKLILQENGGIVYDSIYEQNIQTNRQIINVNLTKAENYVKYSGIGITQKLFISKAEPDFSAIPDTNVLNLNGYRVYHYKKPYFDPILAFGRLTHTFLYSKEVYRYSDSDGASNFYSSIPSFPSEELSTFDSISHSKIENLFTYSNANYKDNIEDPKFLSYSFGIALISNRYSQDTIVNTLSELNPQGKLQLFLTNKINISGTAIFSYRSDNTTAYKLNGNAKISIKENTLNLSFISASIQAPRLYQHFYSNYFQWENNFQNQKHQEISAQFTRKNTQIKFKTGIIHDFLYFDSSVAPQQNGEPLSYFSVSASQIIHLGDFGVDFNVIYQGVSDQSILRVPEIYSHTQLFFENTIFKGALDLKIGINIRYFSSYFANAYMPALRSFYIQNEKEIGNYPYVDVFVNAKIKRARLFFKYEKLNSSFMPQNYLASPHYPNTDASLTFGVIWQLFN